MISIQVHVKEGNCFEASLLKLQYLIPGWIESENMKEIFIIVNGDCVNCQLYEGEEAKALEAKGGTFLGVHTDSGCFVLPCDRGSVRGILGEFLESKDVLEVDVWCAGFADGSEDCQCHAEWLQQAWGSDG